jgi:hypothetical protein
MRLFDQIAQHATPLLVAVETSGCEPRLVQLPGAADFALQIRSCPLRYVLTDDLAAACAELSLAEGDRLRGCLDLIHLPATSFWVEWNDGARARAVSAYSGPPAGAPATKVGALVTATLDGRRGTMRTFWEDPDGSTCLAPVETHLDLDCCWPAPGALHALFDGGLARVAAVGDPALDELLDCLRFRYDGRWAQYYRSARLSAQAQQELLRTSLGAVVRDAPLLLAFALLLAARSATHSRPVDCQRLNRRRHQRNKPPLLAHLEVSCRLDLASTDNLGPARVAGRRTARLHQVRGHLVRRADQIFWRKNHVRGRLASGRVLSRTVQLSCGRPVAAAPDASGI